MNVIITGASKGIGKAIAMKFAASGHSLFLCSRNAAPLVNTAAEIRNANPQCSVKTMTADLSIKESAISFANWCLQNAIPDILVNNAGLYLPGNIIEEKEDALESMMNTNLYSAWHLTRKLLPAMIQNGRGHIFNICSTASINAFEGSAGYGITKFAMNGFNKNLRQELIPHKIKVTGVFPGSVHTDSWENFDNSGNQILEPQDIAELIYTASFLSPAAVVDEIIITPQAGDI